MNAKVPALRLWVAKANAGSGEEHLATLGIFTWHVAETTFHASVRPFTPQDLFVHNIKSFSMFVAV